MQKIIKRRQKPKPHSPDVVAADVDGYSVPAPVTRLVEYDLPVDHAVCAVVCFPHLPHSHLGGEVRRLGVFGVIWNSHILVNIDECSIVIQVNQLVEHNLPVDHAVCGVVCFPHLYNLSIKYAVCRLPSHSHLGRGKVRQSEYSGYILNLEYSCTL